MSLTSHRNAVMNALLEDLPGAVFKPYEATELSRYAVVWIAVSDSPQTRYTGGQWREVFTVTVHSFGQDDDQAFWVAERVGRLKGKVLEVPGRLLWPVEFITQRPPELDDDGPTPLRRVATQFDIVSDPA